MKTNYAEAFDMKFYSEGEEFQVCELAKMAGGIAHLNILTAWEQYPQRLTVEVRVPVVVAQRFPWDGGIFGHVLTTTNVERFCHPRLRSRMYEDVANSGNRQGLHKEIDDWTWESWFDRVNQGITLAFTSLASRMRRPTAPVVRTELQRTISRLLNGGAGSNRTGKTWSPTSRDPGYSGLQLTDEAKKVRQMFEVEVGYPDVPNDSWLYEMIKLEYLKYMDSTCDILCTGKNDTGRFIIRVRPDAPVSHITGQPMSDFMMAISPLSPWGNPTRVEREGRGIIHCHDFVEPTEPPLRLKGVKTPKALAKKIQTVNVAICNITDFNLFVANEQDVEEFDGRVELGEETTLDAILVCPSGRKKLLSYQPKSDLMGADEFLTRVEELKALPGFRSQDVPELLETLEDGTSVHDVRYRYWYDDPVRFRYDKVKLLQGGLKGVGRPIPQLFYQKGDETLEIDIVISEAAVISKGARDAALYPILATAGLTEIDPSSSWEELCQLAEKGLIEQDLPIDGRFDIMIWREEIMAKNGADQEVLALMDPERKHFRRRSWMDTIGQAICGPISVVRTSETENQQSSDRQGVSLDLPTRNIAGIDFRDNPEVEANISAIADFYLRHSSLSNSPVEEPVG